MPSVDYGKSRGVSNNFQFEIFIQGKIKFKQENLIVSIALSR